MKSLLRFVVLVSVLAIGQRLEAAAAYDVYVEQRTAANKPGSKTISPAANSIHAYGADKVATNWTLGAGFSVDDGVLNVSGSGSPGSGTVTSFSAGDITGFFTTSEATATSTPALTFTLATAAANYVWAGPTTGSAATPSYRALVAADIPTIPLARVTDAASASGLVAVNGAGINIGGKVDWSQLMNVPAGFADGSDDGAGGGSGTVTSASVVTANGVSATVANASSTPAFTFTLGAITPSSVNGISLSGSSTPTLAVTGTTAVSGTNTGDQNAFANIIVSGQTTVTANATAGNLTLVGGESVVITTNNTTKNVTISVVFSTGSINTTGNITGNVGTFTTGNYVTLNATTLNVGNAIGSGNIILSPGGVTVTTGKVFSVTNNITLTGTDATSFAFPGTGGNVVTHNSTDSLTNKKLGNLTTNGFVKTTGSDGSLTVDTNTYVISGGAIGAATATTPSADDSDTSVATTAYVQGELTAYASDTVRLTNKRVDARVTTITSSATPTINTDNCDAVTITALATAITSMTSSLTGTPANFDQLMFRIKDDGTDRAITWGASFAARGATLPTTTTAGKVLTALFLWNSVTSTWDCISTANES